jgi:PAS domain S-box-containing protein
MKLGKRISLLIYGCDPETLPIDRRLFILLTFSSFFIGLAGGVINPLTGMGAAVTAVTGVAAMVVGGFYIAARTSSDYYVLYIPFVAVALVAIAAVWFTNGGYNGNLVMLIPVVFVLLHMAARPHHRRLVLLMFIAATCGLIVVQYAQPGWITGYSSESQRFVDLILGAVVYLTMQYVAIRIITSTYEKQADVITRNSQQFMEEKRFTDTLLESMPGLFFFYELNATAPERSMLLRFNRKAEGLTGYTAEELRRMTVADWFTPEKLPGALESLLLLGKTGAMSARLDIRMKNGTEVTYELTGHLLDQGGRPYFLGVGVDVSEYMTAQNALRESEEKYRHLIEGLGDQHCVFSYDARGDFQYVSNTFPSIFGAAPGQVIGRNWRTLNLTPGSVRAWEEANRRVVEHLGSERVELTIVLGDGTERIIEASCTPVLKDGRIEGIEGICTDTTLQKRTEQALLQSQKLESIGTLAGGIAHDFNNLLGMIFGSVELAIEGTKESTTKAYLGNALKAFERIRGLTQQLLTFSKGGAPVRKVEALFPFMQEAARFALSGSNVLCRFEIADDLWLCEFDRNQLGQVVDNIVINAQQAMPAGGEITVTAANVLLDDRSASPLPGGKYVRVEFRDRGVGMPRDVLSRIFDPFYSTKPKGHGLGLATCYSIVTRHGGRMEAESEPGQGSTFRIFLPATEKLPEAGVVPEAPSRAGTSTGKILVMDDEELMRESLKDMLRLLGYEAVCVRSGAEAINAFRAEREGGRDLVAMIFDLTIPGGIGGVEAIQEVRRIDRTIPVIVASGYADDPVMSNPQAFGFSASLSKPFRKSDLGETLRRYVKA